MTQCIAERGRVPNLIAVDFTAVGDLEKTVSRYNRAIAKVTGVTAYYTAAIADAELSRSDLRLLESHRLPKITMAKAEELLGPTAALLERPPVVREDDAHVAADTARARRRAAAPVG